MDISCPVCEKKHTRKRKPTLSEILGPCAEQWWADVERDVQQLQQEHDQNH